MGPDTGSTCRQQLAFMKWADELMLSAVAENVPADIAALQTLQHIYLGEMVWFERVSGKEDALIGDLKAPADIAGLQRSWPPLHRLWLDWGAAVSDWDTIVPHRNQKGERFRMPAWQIALHLVNHGSYHRGQVAAVLRAAGFTPPATDLIVYYRSQNAGQAA